MPVVSSGEATSYNSDSKETIPGPVGHRVEIGEAVALAASSLFLQLTFSLLFIFRALCFLGDVISPRQFLHYAHRDVLLIRRNQRPARVRDLRAITSDDNRQFRRSLSRVHDQSDVEKIRDIGRSFRDHSRRQGGRQRLYSSYPRYPSGAIEE